MIDELTFGASLADSDALIQVGDILDVGVVLVDTQLRVTRWNRWLELAFGQTNYNFAGKTIGELFPEIANTPREQFFRRVIEGDTVILAQRFHHYLLPLPCPPGVDCFDYMQQSARIVPIRVAGRVTGAVAFIQDVSERVWREEELRTAKEAAEAASRAKSDFLAAMSHELRTPLNAVIGYSALLTQQIGGKLTDLHLQHAERIATSAWHLIGIIDEVLTFSRAEAGREEFLIEETDICEVTRTAITLVEPQAMAKKLKIDCQGCCDPIIFHTDQLRMQQILINLLGNAVKFTEEGTVVIQVDLVDGELVIAVSDTGPGVPDEHRELIFDAFTQVDQTATRAKGGTGLGLPVSRKLAELMGGSLTLQRSEPGEGSTFVLRLPDRPNEYAADQSGAAQ